MWGALHGGYLIAGRLSAATRERVSQAIGLAKQPALHSFIKRLITFQLASFAWLFFRAPSVTVAWEMLARFGKAALFACPDPAFIGRLFHPSREGHLLIAGILIVMLLAVEWIASRPQASARWAATPVWVRWPAYYSLIIMTLWVGDLGARSFIYFQF